MWDLPGKPQYESDDFKYMSHGPLLLGGSQALENRFRRESLQTKIASDKNRFKQTLLDKHCFRLRGPRREAYSMRYQYRGNDPQKAPLAFVAASVSALGGYVLAPLHHPFADGRDRNTQVGSGGCLARGDSISEHLPVKARDPAAECEQPNSDTHHRVRADSSALQSAELPIEKTCPIHHQPLAQGHGAPR